MTLRSLIRTHFPPAFIFCANHTSNKLPERSQRTSDIVKSKSGPYLKFLTLFVEIARVNSESPNVSTSREFIPATFERKCRCCLRSQHRSRNSVFKYSMARWQSRRRSRTPTSNLADEFTSAIAHHDRFHFLDRVKDKLSALSSGYNLTIESP